MAYFIGKLKNFIPIKVIRYMNKATKVNEVFIARFAVKTDTF